jgi:hypothetical protein
MGLVALRQIGNGNPMVLREEKRGFLSHRPIFCPTKKTLDIGCSDTSGCCHFLDLRSQQGDQYSYEPKFKKYSEYSKLWDQKVPGSDMSLAIQSWNAFERIGFALEKDQGQKIASWHLCFN